MITARLKAKEFYLFLRSLGICEEEALAWAKGKSLRQAWAQCKRADWMLWLVGKLAGKKGWPTKQQVVLAACACARTALKNVPESERRPLMTIKTAERWARGKATPEEVRIATGDAYTAAIAADSRADYNAAYAAFAAASAASYIVYDGSYAARTAAEAAAASTFATSASARDDAAAMREPLKELAHIVRRKLRVADA